jgi:hypothetical protein
VRPSQAEQLELCTRLVAARRSALSAFGRPWTELPGRIDDWDVLCMIPGAHSAAVL